MSPEMIDLARRAVACKAWRWMPGMAALCTVEGMPSRYRLDGDGGLEKESWLLVHEGVVPGDTARAEDIRPDLSDPATLGCLLALVREALHEPLLHTRPDSGGWYVEREAEHDHEWLRADGSWGEGADPVIWEHTEAEALVAALEAA